MRGAAVLGRAFVLCAAAAAALTTCGVEMVGCANGRERASERAECRRSVPRVWEKAAIFVSSNSRVICYGNCERRGAGRMLRAVRCNCAYGRQQYKAAW